MIDLEVVLITGANQGIGFHIALQLGKLAGYHMVLGVRSVNKGEEAVKRLRALGATSQLSYVILDVDSDESIGNALGRIKSKHGRLDVLVVCRDSCSLRTINN
jgi:NAD(P)-dependent dehydrogenase (short-subunit alcohol dehydrogenase family)